MELISGAVYWDASMLVYMIVIGLLTASGIYVQYKHKKQMEDEENEANTQNIAKNLPTEVEKL